MTAGSRQRESGRNGALAPPTPGPPAARESYHQAWLALSVAVLAICLLIPAPDPMGAIRLPLVDVPLPTVCMMKRRFGVDCPGCGLTRCFLSMAHGRFAAAWDYHPAGAGLFLLVIAQVPYRAYQCWRLRRWGTELKHWTLGVLPCLLIAAVFVHWVLRVFW